MSYYLLAAAVLIRHFLPYIGAALVAVGIIGVIFYLFIRRLR